MCWLWLDAPHASNRLEVASRDTTPHASPDLGDFQFRFAVLADTHINPTDDESPSPWLTNRYANARSRAVVEEINRYEPAFTVHLGDIVHPVPSQFSYAEAANQARSVLELLESPLHCVPGNHDMGTSLSSGLAGRLCSVPAGNG
ncbi:MAG: metallophosphoesterase [Acidimicrobiia bacterium]